MDDFCSTCRFFCALLIVKLCILANWKRCVILFFACWGQKKTFLFIIFHIFVCNGTFCSGLNNIILWKERIRLETVINNGKVNKHTGDTVDVNKQIKLKGKNKVICTKDKCVCKKVSESNSEKCYKKWIVVFFEHYLWRIFSFELYDLCMNCPLVLICTRENGTSRI